jgi:unsaturated rhamnogalacturonyl hydrolase
LSSALSIARFSIVRFSIARLSIVPGFALSLVAITLGFALTATTTAGAAPREFAGSTPLQWSVRYANSEASRLSSSGEFSMPAGKWNYANFLELRSMLYLDDRLAGPAPRYHDFVKTTLDSFLSPDGKTIAKIKLSVYSIDDYAPAVTVQYLYRTDKDPRYKNTIELIRRQLDPGQHPRVKEGAFWHKKRYPHQIWLDGLYMGSPFYAEYTSTLEAPGKRAAAYDDILNQFRISAKYTHDKKTGLYYHAWDESREQSWANKETGQSPNFWSRAIGWYSMALVDVLDFLPDATATDKARRAELVTILKSVLDGVIKHQDLASGCWWQVTDQGHRQGNYLEATASAMFAYTMAKAINRGYIDRATYEAPALKAYSGIIDTLVKTNADGSIDLTQCCAVAGLGYGRDGTYEYYLSEPIINNDPKGAGSFILAGIEFDRLLGINETAKTVPASPAFKIGKDPATTSTPTLSPTPTPTSTLSRPPRTEPIQNPESKIQNPSDPWTLVPQILSRIKAPVFPDRVYSIVEYGAPTDGKGDSTAAIRAAIAACATAGGGTVLIPPGAFVTGPIYLKSNVNLHLEGGSRLLFKTDPDAYMPAVFTRWEGVELMNFSPLIYARGEENIAITGDGVLDGQADEKNWWPMNGLAKARVPGVDPKTTSRARLMRQADEPIEKMDPVKRIYGKGENLRPPFIQPYDCKNILIEGVTIVRSPFWEINPVLCANVTIRGLKIDSHGPNNDGIDPESCTDVLIENTTFDTGDDCIAIKSGRNNDGRRINAPSQNIIIRNCVMKDGHGGVTIGSEISGGCRNVFIEDCRMDSPHLDIAFRFKTNAVRGGVIENIHMRNVRVGRVADSVVRIDYHYEEGIKGDHMPTVRNVSMDNVTSQSSPRAMTLKGFPNNPIRDIAIRNCTFNGVEGRDIVQHIEGLVQENVTINRIAGAPSAPVSAKKKAQKKATP